MVVERSHARELHARRQGGLRRVHVLLNAQRRKLRRERNADHPPDAGRFNLAHGVGDKRPPVAHADEQGLSHPLARCC